MPSSRYGKSYMDSSPQWYSTAAGTPELNASRSGAAAYGQYSGGLPKINGTQQQVSQASDYQSGQPYARQAAGSPYSILDRAQSMRSSQTGNPLLSMLGGQGLGNVRGGQQIDTSITPIDVYTPQQTQQLINQQRASMAQSPESLMKQYDRPGVSRSDAQLSAIAPQMAEQRAAMAAVGGNQQLADAQTNAQARLQAEAARDGEFLGLAGLGQRKNEFDQSQVQQLMQLLMGMGG